MAIGKTSRMSSVRSSLRAPKFLDKAGGFYGRLDEPSGPGGEQRDGEEQETQSGATADISGPTTTAVSPHGTERQEASGETFDYSEGLMEDDGETLLRRKPSRRSSRWRRSSRKKKQQKEETEEVVPQDGTSTVGSVSPGAAPEVELTTGGSTELEEVVLESVEKKEKEEEQPARIHFREEEDDQVLIRDKKRGREEEEEEEVMGEEERRMRREQEQGMKVVKRHTVKNYRKALDRAFRRGWEVFVSNLYSVTLTPVSQTPSSSPSSKTKLQHNTVLAEYR